MEQTPHNPYSKLIETNIFNGTSFLNIVYGINNDGKNEGLEVYYCKEKDGHFHKSRRWTTNEIPAKYNKYFAALKELIPNIKDGHKGNIEITKLLGY